LSELLKQTCVGPLATLPSTSANRCLVSKITATVLSLVPGFNNNRTLEQNLRGSEFFGIRIFVEVHDQVSDLYLVPMPRWTWTHRCSISHQ